MLMIEIGTLWANEEILKDKKVVLFLPLRELDVNKINSSKDMFNAVYQGKEEDAQICTEHFISNNGQGLVILVDGLDENVEAMTFLKTLIKDNVFSKACIIITSRPHATVQLQKYVSYRVEIIGFSDDNRRQFVQENLKVNPNDLEDYLQKHHTINTLCYIPLNMSILLYLFHEKQRLGDDHPLPDSQTELIKQAIIMTILHNLEKLNVPDHELKRDLKSLPKPYNKIFSCLCMLAYDALTKNKLIFNKRDIEVACSVKGSGAVQKAVTNGLGLLQTAKFFSDVSSTSTVDSLSNFAHFSIQEFLAAWHFTFSYTCFWPLPLGCNCLQSSSQLKILKAKFWEGDYMNMWSFYVGITRGEDLAFKHFISGTNMPCYCMQRKHFSISKDILNYKIKTLHLYYFLQEAPDNEMIQHLNVVVTQNQLDVSGEIVNLKEAKTNLELLGHILSRPYLTNQWDRVILSSCKIDDESFEVLYNILTRNDKSPKIKALSLSDNELNSCSDKIVKLVCSQKIYHLDLSSNCLEDMIPFQNCAGFIETLIISNNQLNDEKALNFFEILKYFAKLKVLSLHNNNISADRKMVDALGLALCCCNCLEKLEIYGNMIEDEALLIFDVINDIRNSKSNVHYYRLSDKAFAFLKILGYCDKIDHEVDCVLRNKTIESVGVNISYNGIKADAGCLGQHLHLLINLKRLNITKNNISDNATKSLTIGIFLTPNLEEFNYEENLFSEKSCMIFEMIHKLRTTINKQFKCEPSEIKALLFILNCINDNVEELQSSDIISTLSLVSELSLSHNESTTLDYKLTSEDLQDLCAVLTWLKQLEVLDVRNNDITHEAKESLTKVMLQIGGLNCVKLVGNPIFDDQMSMAVLDTIIKLHEGQVHSISCNQNSCFHEEGYCVIYIMECLNSLENMNHLNIFDNITTLDIDSESELAGKIFDCLNYLPFLREIIINHVSCITKYGMNQFSEYLSRESTLTTLDLSFCNLENFTIKKVVRVNDSLKTLKCNCSKIADELLRNFMLMFRNVDHLEIEGNHLGDEGISTLHNVLLSYEHGQPKLNQLVNLKTLNIANNNISDESIRILTTEILLAAKLEEFKYNENLFSENSIMIFEMIHKLRTAVHKSFKCEPSEIKALLFILNCIDDNEEEQQSSDIISTITYIEELICSHDGAKQAYKITSMDLIELCTTLPWFKQLKILDVRNNSVTDEAKESLALVMLKIHTLNTLKLTGNPIFDDEHSMAVFDTIKKVREKQVKSIIVAGQQSSSNTKCQSIIYIMECLNYLENPNCSKLFNTITTLNVDSKLGCVSKFFEYLDFLPFLYSFKVNNVTCITDHGMNKLCNYISQSKALITLDLSFCNLKNLKIESKPNSINSLRTVKLNYGNISCEVLYKLSLNMIVFTNLNQLEIEGNSFGDKGISDLHNVLLNSKNDQLSTIITAVSLANNQLTSRSSVKIIETVQKCKVKYLNISDNHLQSIFCYFEKLKIMTLEELNISANNHQTYNATQFAKNISYLKSCSSLKKLNISNNSIDETAINEIYYSFMECVHLEEVTCDGNPAENEIEVAFYFVKSLCTDTFSKNIFKIPPSKIKALVYLLRCLNDNEEKLQSSDMVSRLGLVTELNLSHNDSSTLEYKLTSEDLRELCKVLTLNQLEVLDVRNNDITNEAKESLVRLMLQINTLNSVKLIGNPIFDDKISMGVFDTIKKLRDSEKQLRSIIYNQRSPSHVEYHSVIYILECLSKVDNPNCFKSFDNIVTLDIESESDYAGKFFEYLNYLSCLKNLKINKVGCITDYGMKQLSNYLSHNKLTTLDLSFCNLQNLDIENEPSGYIPLKVLKLNRSNITEKVLFKLSHLLKFANLDELDLGGNFFGDKGVSNLHNVLLDCENDQLSIIATLNLANNQLTSSSAVKIIEIVQKCRVKYLNISHNYLGSIFLSFENFIITTLEELNISTNNYQTHNAVQFAENISYLKSCSSLQKLDISNNSIDETAIDEIYYSFMECVHLKEIICNGNSAEKDIKEAFDFVQSLYQQRQHCVERINFKELRKATLTLISKISLLHRDMTVSLATSAKIQVQQVRSIDFSHNELRIDQNFTCVLQNCIQLEFLNLENNDITTDTFKHLAAGFLFTSKLMISNLNFNGNPCIINPKNKSVLQMIESLRSDIYYFVCTPAKFESFLTVLELVDGVSNKPNDIAKTISLIKTLNLSSSELTSSLNQHTTKLQSDDIKIFCNYLNYFESLESINMTSNNIKEDVKDDLAIAVLRNYHVTEIHLEGNPIHTCHKLFETIGKLRRCRYVYPFKDIPRTLEALVNILRYVKDFPDKTCDITNNIEHLDISSFNQSQSKTRYGYEGKIDHPEKISTGLIYHLTLFRRLITLNLHNAYLTLDSLQELSKFLCNNNTLLQLDISNNDIQAEGALIIVKSLIDTNTTLKKLNLSNNKIIGEKRKEVNGIIDSLSRVKIDMSGNEPTKASKRTRLKWPSAHN